MNNSTTIYVVHDEPIGRSADNYIARIDLAAYGLKGQVEQVWLRKGDDDTYEVRCIPFCAYGLAYLDLVRLGDGGVYVTSIVKRSGNRVFRILLSVSSDVDSMRCSIEEKLSDLGLMREWNKSRHVAIDVPPGADVSALMRVLDQGAREGRIVYEWGDVVGF